MTKTTSAIRTRWAAIGAAVAVTLGAGIGSGVLTINAAPLDNESDVVTVDPVRIVDTRSGVGISSAFVSGTDYGLKVTGTVPTTGGDAEVVPQFATGVILNVTVVRPTSNGFVSVVPATAGSGPYPTSNLNFTAGANTPNAVTVALPGPADYAFGDPRIGSLNLRFDGEPAARTDVLVDVVGYMTESVVLDHERRLNNLEETSPIAVAHSSTVDAAGLSATRVVESLEMAVPKDGDIVVNSSVRVLKVGGLAGIASCSITTGTMLTGEGTQSVRIMDGETNTLSGTRGFRVLELDGPVTVNLVSGSAATGLTAFDSNLTATYVPVDPELSAGG